MDGQGGDVSVIWSYPPAIQLPTGNKAMPTPRSFQKRDKNLVLDRRLTPPSFANQNGRNNDRHREGSNTQP